MCDLSFFLNLGHETQLETHKNPAELYSKGQALQQQEYRKYYPSQPYILLSPLVAGCAWFIQTFAVLGFERGEKSEAEP